MTRHLLPVLTLLIGQIHSAAVAQSGEPVNPFVDLKSAAQAAIQEAPLPAPAVSLPPPAPPIPGPASPDAGDLRRIAQVQVLAVIGSSALLSMGAGANAYDSLSTFEIQDLKPALVGGVWVVPAISPGQVLLFRHEALRVARGTSSIAPDAVPIFQWRGGAPARNEIQPNDAAPKVVGPEPVSPSKRNIKL
jgi:hypothetical protein